MAKIVLYTPEAKCSLMETGVDFEAVFLCGVKISIYRENFKYDDPLKIKIINNVDKSESSLDFDRVTAPNISAIEHFSPEIRQILENAMSVCRRAKGLNEPSPSFRFSATRSACREIKFSKRINGSFRPFKPFQSSSERNTPSNQKTSGQDPPVPSVARSPSNSAARRQPSMNCTSERRPPLAPRCPWPPTGVSSPRTATFESAALGIRPRTRPCHHRTA